MTVSRLTALTLLAAAGFALLPRSAAVAQDKEPPLPSKSTASFTRVNEYKSDPRKVSGELAQAKDHMKAFAKYYADFLAHPLVYRVIQDPAKLPQGVLLSSLNIDEKIAEMGRYLAEPQPNNRSAGDSSQVRYNSDYADFIRELGAALDESLMKLVREHPERIVRVNAMRAYIVACKTGAAPHWPTVTNLLKDPKTRPEIKILALQAAANLFAAYDPDDYPSRRHAIGSKRPRIDADKEIGTLVKAVQDCVTTPKMLLADYPDGKGPKKSASPGQVEVLRYARREAIRALAKVRFVKLPGPGGDDDPLYPAFTLARVCMADPALGPTPTPSESAEAVLGLANMAPVWNGKPVENYSAEAAALAVANGLVNFASPKANRPDDASTKWNGYGLELSDAFTGWPPIFNFLHNPVRPNPADADAAPAIIKELIRRADKTIVAPLTAKGGQVSVDDLRTLIKTLGEKPDSKVLFKGVPATTLPGLQGQ